MAYFCTTQTLICLRNIENSRSQRCICFTRQGSCYEVTSWALKSQTFRAKVSFVDNIVVVADALFYLRPKHFLIDPAALPFSTLHFSPKRMEYFMTNCHIMSHSREFCFSQHHVVVLAWPKNGYFVTTHAPVMRFIQNTFLLYEVSKSKLRHTELYYERICHIRVKKF